MYSWCNPPSWTGFISSELGSSKKEFRSPVKIQAQGLALGYTLNQQAQGFQTWNQKAEVVPWVSFVPVWVMPEAAGCHGGFHRCVTQSVPRALLVTQSPSESSFSCAHCSWKADGNQGLCRVGTGWGLFRLSLALPDCSVLLQYQHHYLLLPPPLHLLPGPRERLVRELGRVPALERPQEAEQLRRGGGGILSVHPQQGNVEESPSSLLGFQSSLCRHCLVVVVYIPQMMWLGKVVLLPLHPEWEWKWWFWSSVNFLPKWAVWEWIFFLTAVKKTTSADLIVTSDLPVPW